MVWKEPPAHGAGCRRSQLAADAVGGMLPPPQPACPDSECEVPLGTAQINNGWGIMHGVRPAGIRARKVALLLCSGSGAMEALAMNAVGGNAELFAM